MKVIRRLELAKLEEHCWQYMMTVIDGTNCLLLHEFADRYDCPALKLTAWRMIQETTPAYAAMPSMLLDASSSLVSPRSGLTGPAESFRNHMNGDFHEEEEEFPSILNPETFEFDSSSYPQPDELPPNACASDVVRAWALRLQDVHSQCFPPNNEYYNNGNQRNVDWAAELKEVYSILNLPDKVPLIDQILEMYVGKETQMMQSILVKYRAVLPTEYVYRLTELIAAYS